MSSNPFATGGAAPATSASPFSNTTNQPATGANGHADPSTQQLEQQTQQPPEPPIDVDALLTSENLTAQAGDAFAEPPPVPDAIYRVRLSLRGITSKDYKGRDITPFAHGADTAPWVPEAQKDKQGNTVGHFAKALMNVQVYDPKFPEFDGLYLRIPFGGWIDTKTAPQAKVSKVMTILNLLKQPSGQPWLIDKQKYSDKQLIEIFVKALAGEPEILCQSYWSVQCDVCADTAQKTGGRYPKSVDGMHNFPQLKPGVWNPEVRCQAFPAHGL